MSQTPQDVSTLSYHWIVQRPDGAGFATTSHDRRQVRSGRSFDPDVELRPGELILSEELLGSSMRLEGGLTSHGISDSDLQAGLWSGAAVRLLSGDWVQEVEPFLLSEGTLGEIRFNRDRFSTSIDLLPEVMARPPCVQTSPECRASLGDRQCGVDMRSRKQRIVVAGVDANTLEVEQATYEAYRMGRLRWISGPNCGLDQTIINVDDRHLQLLGAPSHSIAVGDRAMISEGCDGRRVTCSERFGNVLNFRGEPDLPGSEILMRFPGA